MARTSSCLFLALFGLALSARSSGDELGLLVSPAELASYMDAHAVRILDARRSRIRFRFGHISQALFLPTDSVFDTVDGVDGRLPSALQVARAFEEVGIGTDLPVVVYDDSDGLWAARFFWALEYLGHDDVHILDGGLRSWKDAGYGASRRISDVPESHFEVNVQPNLLISSETLLEDFDEQGLLLIDTRSPAEYTGKKSFSKRKGHIPGAMNIDWVENLSNGEGSSFLRLDDLDALYESNGVTRDMNIVTYCQAGVRAAHAYFALRLLGYEHVALYDDSWEHWGNSDETPVER